MTLQEKIFDEMKKRGITQRELSEITGIATSTINDWKMRNHVPAADKIPAICNAINISIADLYKDVDCNQFPQPEVLIIPKGSIIYGMTKSMKDAKASVLDRLRDYMVNVLGMDVE